MSLPFSLVTANCDLKVQRVKSSGIVFSVSAKGAGCNSQGQSAERSEVRRPWNEADWVLALKERHKPLSDSIYCALSALSDFWLFQGATCFAVLSTCPWLFQFAPLALRASLFKP